MFSLFVLLLVVRNDVRFGYYTAKGVFNVKKIVSIVIVFVLMLSALTTNVFAQAHGEEHNRYQYTRSCRSSLSISGNTATCVSIVKGYSGETTKIEVTQRFEKLLSSGWWYGTQSWNQTYYNWYALFENTKSVSESGTYQVRTIAKVYAGSNYETVEVCSSSVSV